MTLSNTNLGLGILKKLHTLKARIREKLNCNHVEGKGKIGNIHSFVELSPKNKPKSSNVMV